MKTMAQGGCTLSLSRSKKIATKEAKQYQKSTIMELRLILVEMRRLQELLTRKQVVI